MPKTGDLFSNTSLNFFYNFQLCGHVPSPVVVVTYSFFIDTLFCKRKLQCAIVDKRAKEHYCLPAKKAITIRKKII